MVSKDTKLKRQANVYENTLQTVNYCTQLCSYVIDSIKIWTFYLRNPMRCSLTISQAFEKLLNRSPRPVHSVMKKKHKIKQQHASHTSSKSGQTFSYDFISNRNICNNAPCHLQTCRKSAIFTVKVFTKHSNYQ